MPATMNASTTEGPARSAMAAAVRTNRPAPMMAPMPRAMSDSGPRVRFSVCSPVAAASFIKRSIDLVLNSEPATNPPSVSQCDDCVRTGSAGAKVAALYDTLSLRMRRVRLGIVLTALLLVTSLPLAGLAAWLAWNGAAQQQALIAAQNVDKVRGISAALDLEVERSMGALVALTTLQPIDA